jgi:imidazolonepropionase-like amidohydrolase
VSRTILENCALLDVEAGCTLPDRCVVVEGERIIEVSERPVPVGDARRLDVHGRTLMPGLCDAHVHVTQLSPDLRSLRHAAPSYVAAQASTVLRAMLRRGFTTVRDAGGADYGLADAVAQGLFEGPRLLYCGHALSQTGGHGDMRERGDDRVDFCAGCVGRAGRICDGVDEVRRAVRDELRKGAHQIKLMVNGGVTSPHDRIDNVQFSLDEIRAAVEEAQTQRRYVMAHAYTAEAINRALDCGVRSIEHGNMLDQQTAEHIVRSDAFLVPTLVVFWAMVRHGETIGLSAVARAKAAEVERAAMRGLELAMHAGVRMAFGSDLFGPLHVFQSGEFAIRAEVQKPIDVIRAATIRAAELFEMVGQIGSIVPGAYADLLVVDGDPLADLNLLQDDGRHLDLIMKGGRIVVDQL